MLNLHSVSLARFSNTLHLLLFLNNFCKWLLTLSMSPILIKVGVPLSVHHASVSSLFLESLHEMKYFLSYFNTKGNKYK